MTKLARLLALAFAGIFVVASVQAQNITVQVGSAASPPTSLIDHTNIWHWHKGTNAPQANWQTVADGTLNTDWGSGPGGFGYADNTTETNITCKTILSDMNGTATNNYSTFYIRKTFTIGGGVDTNAHIQLTMDWDDGFIAWLDGVYITNRIYASSAEPLFTATTGGVTHESHNGNGGPQPAETYDLGAVGTRTGTHVLAIIGLNAQKSGSSDFILVADMALTGSGGGGGTVVNGTFFSIAPTNSVTLSGTNSFPGSARVTVNGDDAVFNASTGAWSSTNTLRPWGINPLFIAALDANGALLGSTNINVVPELSSTSVSGTLSGSNFWNNTMGNIHVTGPITIPAGATLVIASETTVLFSPGVGITLSGGTLKASAGPDDPTLFGPSNGTSEWGPITSSGASSSVTIRHGEIIAGHFSTSSGSPLLLEDSLVHNTMNNTLFAGSGGNWTFRRVHVHHFHDTEMDNGVLLAEDSLFEDAFALNAGDTQVDPFEMSGGQNGTLVQRITMRRVPSVNADAFDVNTGTGITFRNILVHDIGDKGFSLGTAGGAASQNMVVSNCLIWNARTGVAIKDGSTANVIGNTIVDSLYGIQAYPKYSVNGGQLTNGYNNILWNNATTLTITNGFMVLNFSDLGGSVFYGTNSGNFTNNNSINADPLFVNAAARDYHLAGGSPCIGTGLGGANMGVTLPVGGLPATPFALAALGNGSGPVQLAWQEDSDNETSFVIERSTNVLNQLGWSNIGSVGANVTNFTDNTVVTGTKYYYRVHASNSSGDSEPSNIASSKSLVVVAGGNVGGTINSDTCWAGNGVFTVTSSITVPAGVTLYIKPGASVQFNSGASLTVANGGTLLAEGASNGPINFTRSGASSWGGVTINGAVGSPETHIEWANFLGNSQNPCIQVTGGTIFFDHLTFSNTAAAYIHLDGASFIVQNCNFPKTSAALEPVHGTGGVRSDGHGFILRNFWGGTTGYNDLIDFTGGNRPGPIIHFIENVLTGASDDMLDLDGTDSWVEHNIFMHSHKNGSPDTSSCVSSGDDSGSSSEITIIGNLMFDVDQAAMDKGTPPGFFTLINNTIVHQNHSGGADTDGAVVAVADVGFAECAGMYLEGNIIADAEKLFRYHTNSIVTYINNIISTNGNWTTNLLWTGPGGNNSTNDPLFKTARFDGVTGMWTVGGSNLNVITSNFTSWAEAQVLWDWFSLQTNSPARSSGPNGLDKGGVISRGASVSGAPVGTTAQSNATLVVGINRSGNGILSGPNNFPLGSGYTHYKWRLDGGAWSAETPIAAAITLSNLAAGPHYVEVTGKRDSGIYQDDPLNSIETILSRTPTWTVAGAFGGTDSDGDGIPDDWEIVHGLNPNDPSDAAFDPDGDGMTNLQEYLAGTDPHSFNSRLWLNSLATAGTNFTFSFVAVSNKSYTVEYRNSLSTGTWLRLRDFAPALDNGTITITNAPGTTRFYQVVTPSVP